MGDQLAGLPTQEQVAAQLQATRSRWEEMLAQCKVEFAHKQTELLEQIALAANETVQFDLTMQLSRLEADHEETSRQMEDEVRKEKEARERKGDAMDVSESTDNRADEDDDVIDVGARALSALQTEIARLRDSNRTLEDKRKRMQAQLKQLTRDEKEWKVERERLRSLEGEVKEWQGKYVDSEERLLLTTSANEKAVEEMERIKAKLAAAVEQVDKAQGLKAEMDGKGTELREVREEMAVLRGKDMEEKPLPVLQELLTFHQQMVVRLHSVITAHSEREKRAEKWRCKICYEGEVSILLQPCNHAVMCGRCAPLVSLCPICRATIEIRSLMYV